ncbi:hypothetical protein AVHY2522_12875 [Acidovorax sp. SUPP2522]|uniref:hypothetical protein n=1 Tax=unclassified Acidovorax TaxID=2684926 RepID=UPI00234B91DB|nr:MULTISPECIES: hypothetical protein [unclassified Acidovorax]WCM98072.1 hypothetical protein M5C96_00910 [Acidovorax sp. GBBC 1281]GKT16763.1 hypothetical protein AVHY2522_12875 [Acidovorax sp. SUPP2522]
MPIPLRAAIACAAALLACGAVPAQAPLPTAAAATAGPSLRLGTESRFIRLHSPPGEGWSSPMTDAPRLRFEVRMPTDTGVLASPRPFIVTLDTGSTGVVISAVDLPGYSRNEEARQANEGWEYRSSSRQLLIGHWVVRDVVLNSGWNEVIARVPVLAVEKEIICPRWDQKANRPECENPTYTTESPGGIAYMGVGFGREHDGQPQGMPDKNPLLNIAEIGGNPVARGAVHGGYIVTKYGIYVGLAPDNVRGFQSVKLQPGSRLANGQPASNDPRDWQQTTMAVSVDGGAPQTGPVLVDTGIAQMYLTAADPSALPTAQIPNPSRRGQPVTGLKDGTRVQVMFPDAQAPVAQYDFRVGDADAPQSVLVNAPGRPAFVNTGRHLLRQFDLLYDAEGGWFGLRLSRR